MSGWRIFSVSMATMVSYQIVKSQVLNLIASTLPAVALWAWNLSLRPELTLKQHIAVLIYFTAVALLLHYAVRFRNSAIKHLVLFIASFWLGATTFFNGEYFQTYVSFIGATEIRVIVDNLEYWASASEAPVSEIAVGFTTWTLGLYALFFVADRHSKRRIGHFMALVCVSCLFFLSRFDSQWHPGDLSLARNLVSAMGSRADIQFESQRQMVQVTPPDKSKSRPNILLIITESLRADHLPQYGYQRNTLPFFQSNFEETMAFKAIASAAVTPPAVGGILSGRYSGYDVSLGGKDPLAWAFFNKLGYQTLLFSSHWYEWNQGRFKQFVIDPRHIDKLSWPETPSAHGGRPDLVTIDAFINVLPELSDQPVFAVLHLRDQHYAPIASPNVRPFQPSFVTRNPEEIQALINLYDNSILSLDSYLERIMEALGQAFLDDTLIVLTSDHGEAFYEHGMAFHTTVLWQEVLEVPLLIRLPKNLNLSPEQARHLRQNLNHWVSVTDVLPTLLNLLGASTDSVFDGKSLLGSERHQCVLTVTNKNHYAIIFTGTGKKVWVDNINLKMRISDLLENPSESNHTIIDISAPIDIEQIIAALKQRGLIAEQHLSAEATSCLPGLISRTQVAP